MAEGKTQGGGGAKGEMRRQQVIDAASDCFRREGFRGASIARISQTAAMSPGHIYHYFSNKEAIVEAIVHQEESDFADLVAALKAETETDDFMTAIARQLDSILERVLHPERSALMLEIAAEAARNPKIAAIVEESNRRMANEFYSLAGQRGNPAIANALSDSAVRTRLEILPVLLSGLTLRSVHNPAVDRKAMREHFVDILSLLWQNGGTQKSEAYQRDFTGGRGGPTGRD